MEISVDLTLTPLQDSHEEKIVEFIKSLRSSGLTVIENPLSTQVYGEYDKVMRILQEAIKNAFNEMDNGLLYMKVVKSNRSDYEPHF
ncbi:MAG: thiamine-binding protein [Flavobacteriaceae bacterium]